MRSDYSGRGMRMFESFGGVLGERLGEWLR